MSAPTDPSHSPRLENAAAASEVARTAERVLARIRSELLELDPAFDVDSDLFHAGLDSMSIMQVLLILEQEFAAKLPPGAIKRETFATARRIAEAVTAQQLVS